MKGPRLPSSSARNRRTSEGDAARVLALKALRELYTRVDDALEGWACDASTECCRFGVTGREPYPTAVELAELERAVRARGGLPKRRLLPVVASSTRSASGRGRGGAGDKDERRCALLGDDGRCLVYASRPFGCRTYFCERARGPAGERADSGLPRELIAEISREIAALSAQFDASDPGPRPLSRASRDWEAQRSRR